MLAEFRIKKALMPLAATCLSVGLIAAPAAAQDPIVNGSFENNYTGWTLFEGAPGSVGNARCGIWGIATNGQTINQGDITFDFFDGLNVQHTFPTNALPTTYIATDGNFVAYQLQNCTQTHRMSQVINVCSGATDLTWDMEYESNVNFIGKNASPGFAQELAVEIRDVPGTIILGTLFTTDPASPTIPANPLAVPLQAFSADISAFAGQTVRLTVDMQVNENPLAAYFDNFRIDSCDIRIDIKPGSFPNSINQGSGGVIPVAILGSATFDATAVDGSTCTLGGAEVKLAGKSEKLLCSVEDVSGPPPGPGGPDDPSGVEDGFLDLVCKFVTADLGAALGDSEATVACTDPVFSASDSIRIVPPE